MNAVDLTRTNELSRRLSALSRERFYDVYHSFEWPERLDPDRFAMSPEITTLAGTEVWSALTDEQIRALTIYETATLFSNTLNGERLLVSGLATQLYGRDATPEITDYLHHFLDEENKHMIMFGVFCDSYAGRVYPEKKLAFDRAYLTELAAEHVPQWPEETLAAFRKWLAGFMRVNWVTFYNPAAYRDAGIENPYEVQQIALASDAQKALRRDISRGTVRFFQKIGLLEDEPEL